MRLHGRTAAARQALGRTQEVTYSFEYFFYVLRIDGAVDRISANDIEAKLKRMDESWLRDLITLYSPEELRIQLVASKPPKPALGWGGKR